MTISYWLDKSHEKSTKTYDYIIVGAGVAGLSTAYWLEKNNPNCTIALIDKTYFSGGASGRNAGFVTCGSAEHFNKLMKQFGLEKAVEIWKFSENNRKLISEEIIENQPQQVDFFQTGSCTVAPTAEDWDRYHNLVKTMSDAGIDVELIDEKYLSSHYGVRNFLGAIQYKHDGIIHPVKLLTKLKDKLKKTDTYQSEEVFQIKNSNDSCEIRTQKNHFSCGKVFICLNGFVGQLLPEYKSHVLPQRSQVVVTSPLPAFVKGPCYLTKHLCYFRQLPTGELLVGGFRNHDLENENTATDDISDIIQNALTDFTRSYFQNTQDVQINYRWSGIMGFTSDGQMLIGEHPQRNNLHVMAGCSSHGMGLSFHAAKTLVENALDKKSIPSHLSIERIKLV